ncbi:MAG: DUF438 domain-containing protein [Spirochaetales bacterium]|nr:DUF438 domain-containing protein [Spirochaetales bacterium]MBP7264355.1 DUF438 domain-containing protein [Spirochaetia bacterium]
MGEPLQNSHERAAAFRALLAALTGGFASAEDVRRARPWIDGARPEDLTGAVDDAVARGVDFGLLKPAVSKLVNLLHPALDTHRLKLPAGERLFSSLMAENAGLSSLLAKGKAWARAFNDDPASAAALDGLRELAAGVAEVETHYRKKENVLFPWFEKNYPEYRCVRLMWDIQDDARRGMKDLAALLSGKTAPDTTELNRVLGRLYFDLNANILREEIALYPVMRSLMKDDDADALFNQCLEYGFCFLSPDDRARFLAAGQKTVPGTAGIPPHHAGQGFSGRTGSLSPEALAAIFAALPVDMTWVDADDTVRWYSDSPHRIFPRSPAIVGRDVRNCHPGASVGRVVAILDAFRSGARDHEAFWISMKGRFISIEYYALRDQDGSYLGTLEVSQDLTDKRALTGEKRLADG